MVLEKHGANIERPTALIAVHDDCDDLVSMAVQFFTRALSGEEKQVYVQSLESLEEALELPSRSELTRKGRMSALDMQLSSNEGRRQQAVAARPYDFAGMSSSSSSSLPKQRRTRPVPEVETSRAAEETKEQQAWASKWVAVLKHINAPILDIAYSARDPERTLFS